MFFKSKKLIGLDIGTANIKMAELDVGRKSAKLMRFHIAPTPARAINGGEVVDPAAISDAIKSMGFELASKRKNVAVGLWGTSVITKRISIPKMDQSLVAGQIRWEAEQYIPFDINEVNIDFKILKHFQSAQESMDVLLVAARQDMAYLYQDIVQGAGMNCSVIDVSAFALANAYLLNYENPAGQAVALVNIGAAITSFVVVDGGEVVFARDIPVGGLTYSSEIHKSMGISLEEAEAMKLSACNGQAAPDEVTKIIQSSHGQICEEVQGSLDFFLNTSPGAQVSHFVVSGGASRTTGLVKALSEHTKVRFEPFDPFVRVQSADRSMTMEYLNEIREFAAIAIGLGSRSAGDA